ncbi:LOW QUALITY PROTEIN: UDPGT domain-containing protein, partial [Cephalotus follicularis]
PLCAIIDFLIGWTKGVFWKFNIPVIGLFTIGVCTAAMEWGAWKVNAGDLKPGETLPVPELPEEMSLTHSDMLRKSFGQPRGSSGPKQGGGGPPKLGDHPPWVPKIQGSIGLMFNACDYIDRTFIEYMANQMGMPAWGMGPLLPQQYWNSSGSLIHNRERQSNFTEDEITQWLDSKRKPRKSVSYVAFGSEVGPTMEEHPQLAGALEELDRPFVWVIQPESGGLDKKVDRGLIICGWVPQLLILSHKSMGGFLSHCGWNSTMEAIGRGIPFLAWPVRGDQYFNAKLVVSYHKVGYRVAHDLSLLITKDDILKGVERLMGDIQMKRRVVALSAQFEHGFPATSVTALDAFEDFI